MKKHPLIRPLHYDKLHEVEGKFPQYSSDTIEAMSNKELRNFGKQNRLIVKTENNSYIPTFVYDNSGTPVHIALPDMSLVYLRLAYVNIKSLDEARVKLFKDSQKPDTGLESSYSYIGAATISIVNIYTSIESFCNQIIPQSIIYPLKERLDYKAVVRTQSTTDKIKFVLPFCFRKSFKTVNLNAYNYLLEIIKVRDEIVHLKYEGKIDDQVELFQKLLAIDYSKLYNAAVSFFNLYRVDYAIECPCENEF